MRTRLGVGRGPLNSHATKRKASQIESARSTLEAHGGFCDRGALMARSTRSARMSQSRDAGSVERVIVQHDEHTIAGLLKILLEVVDSDLDREFERGKRVLGCQPGSAAMCDD